MNETQKNEIASKSGEGEIHIGSFEEIRNKEVVLVKGASRPIAVFYSDGKVFAVDNRCPHLGFPLHKGTVSNGRLTCHWHEARFDLCSGCTFDLWADDVPAFDVDVRDGEVYVSMIPRQNEDKQYYKSKLENGLVHNVTLIQAKAILGFRKLGIEHHEILGWIANFGMKNHVVWGQGMTILAIVGNLAKYLDPETLDHAIIRASRQVSKDCIGKPQPRKYNPLQAEGQTTEQLKGWLKDGVKSRQRDASERTLQSLLELDRDKAIDAYLSAVSDRVYVNDGHQYDAANKSFELLDQIGWENAGEIIPLTLHEVLNKRGAEEMSSWHNPVELIEPLCEVEKRLVDTLAVGKKNINEDWRPLDILDVLLGDDALKIIRVLEEALVNGVSPVVLAETVSHAAAIRLARFAKSNEVGDWFSPQHTFIFCHAVYQYLQRMESADIVRNVFHGALAVYQDRFLNVPAAPLPKDVDLNKLSEDKDEILENLLSTFDGRGDWKNVGNLVARYIRLDFSLTELINTLTLATIREDLDFHTLQVLESAVRLAEVCDNKEIIELIFIGSARQLEAVCPTPRASYKQGLTAEKLGKGVRVFED